MRPLEIVLVLLVAGLLAAHAVRAVPRKCLLALAAAGLATATLSVFLGQARWQMTPVYVVLAVSSLLLLKRSFSHVALRSLGVALGTLLLATGAAASLGLPILTLPPPDGPHAVGVTSASLVDTTRDNAFFGVPGEARELYVQAWYPGARAALEVAARPRTLWEELYRGALDRFTFFSRYLRELGYDARTEHTQYEGETGELNAEAETDSAA